MEASRSRPSSIVPSTNSDINDSKRHAAPVASQHNEPSENMPLFSSSENAYSRPKEEKGPTVELKDVQNPSADSTWLPLTLRLPYLSFLFALSLCLGILVLALTLISIRNYGLGDDNSSSALLFGWRFSPTLAATIYGLLIASLLNDVRRTEVFALLSRPGGASADNTLCFPSRFWWNDPVDALKKERRSWALFFTSTLYILALIVSPLSAGLLSPTDVEILQPVNFQRAKVNDFSWQRDEEDSIMFRTISGAVLNQSTSAWVSKSSAILPFWPSDYESAPLGSNSTTDSHPKEWRVPSVVYTVEPDCQPMSLVANYNATYNWTEVQSYSFANGTRASVPQKNSANYTFFQLKSQDDCVITFADNPEADWIQVGGGWWAQPPDYNATLPYGMSNSTLACGNRTMFFANAGMPDLKIQSHLCSDRFYSAEVLATVSMNQSATVVTYDFDEYVRSKRPLDPLVYHVSQLQAAFFSPNWSTHFLSPDAAMANFAGPLLSIAASTKYNNDPDKLVADSNLGRGATEFYQQFLGEMLLAALERNLGRDAETVPGQVFTLKRRILVSSGIGITLAAILLVSSGSIAFIAYATRPRRRALNLIQDPGTMSAASILVFADRDVRAGFLRSDRLSQRDLKKRLGKRRFAIAHGNLISVDESEKPHGEATPFEPLDGRKDHRPLVIKGWIGVLLLSFVLILVGAIAGLYAVSRTTGIYQSPFVYQLNASIVNNTATLAPYSIIPTILALGLKLWFAAVGDTLKRLQPFVSMTKAPVPASKSVLAEYVNTPIALVSAKALRNSHWILALVSFGALATEIFTVGMSALWDREMGTSMHHVNVTRHLEIRKTPHIFQQDLNLFRVDADDSLRTAALASIYRSSLQSWIYGGAVELSQSGPTPAWSKDTWSFAPLDVNDIKTAAASLSNKATGVSGNSRNITFQTSALRGRLECHVSDYPSNTSAWLETLDFTDRTINPFTHQSAWNATNSPPDMDHGYLLIGMASGGPRYGALKCCANETDGNIGDAALGYWTNNVWMSDYLSYGDMSMSMTATWIVGRPLEKRYQINPGFGNDGHPLFVWTEQPSYLQVNCTPFIEQANAKIVAEVETGIIHSYELLEPPRNATEAWLDSYLLHNTSVDYTGLWMVDYRSGINSTTTSNMTASFGHVFWDALLNANRAAEISTNKMAAYWNDPDVLADRSFSFQVKGLNADFMSYSMLALANNSKEALLDPDTYIKLANHTFGVFFKHFVSDNVTSASGGNAYQPIGEKLPWSLGPVMEDNSGHDDIAKYQGALGMKNDVDTGLSSVNAIIEIPVEQLVMSPTAVFLCLALLVFLVVVTITMYVANHGHYKKLPRSADTLASILAYVYGSQRLLTWSETAPRTKPWYKTLFSTNRVPGAEEPRAYLGPFRNSDGEEVWGIDLIEPETHGSPVETGSAIELSKRTKVERSIDGNGDLALQPALLGGFGWESDNTSARYSDLTTHEPQAEEGDSVTPGEEEYLMRDSESDELSSHSDQGRLDSRQ